jgi:DNA-binding CsgD family transcriptional regulator
MANAAVSNDPLASRTGQDLRLTVKEQEVLALASTGWSTVAIARALGLAPEAVRQLLASTIRRVGARSKIEAVMIAVRSGLIELPTDPERSAVLPSGRPAPVARSVIRLRSWGNASQRTREGSSTPTAVGATATRTPDDARPIPKISPPAFAHHGSRARGR